MALVSCVVLMLAGADRMRLRLAERSGMVTAPPGLTVPSREPGAGGVSACGFEGCAGLYVAVRGIGGAEGPAYVHIVDSVVAAGIAPGHVSAGQKRYRDAGGSGL